MKLSPEAQKAYRVQRYGERSMIQGVCATELRRHHDDGGAMIELMRPTEDPPAGLEGFELAQMNYSTLQPGAIKAFHVHMRQTDVWFVPPEDRVLLVLLDVREGSPTEGVRERRVLGDGTCMLMRIPPGVAHGCRNVGGAPARIVYFTDRLFSAAPDQCDEGRLPWDWVGADVWEISRE